MDIATFSIKGDTTKLAALNLVDSIIGALKMHRAHDAISYDYPVNGAGGLGHTLIQPITESFIAFDAWPDFGGAYLVICSCKTVNLDKVMKKVRACGYTIEQTRAHELNLCGRL